MVPSTTTDTSLGLIFVFSIDAAQNKDGGDKGGDEWSKASGNTSHSQDRDWDSNWRTGNITGNNSWRNDKWQDWKKKVRIFKKFWRRIRCDVGGRYDLSD